jgi:DNA repair exonuclease SbcCD ATPase subunit
VRLRSLTVSGFRGFAGEQSFDLSADVVLVHGPNGSGKTSFFDAVLWALTGTVDRLGPDSTLVSRYAEFGEARVQLALRAQDGTELLVVRRFDGESTVTVASGGRQATGLAAEAQLRELVWPESNAAPDPGGSLTRSVTRAIYLQQDQVRSFLEAEDEQSRFAIVAEIVGAGRVGGLVRQLESARKAWSTSSNRLREELEPLIRRRDLLRNQVTELEGGGGLLVDVDQVWIAWRRRTASLLGPEMPATDGERSRALERCLDALRKSQRRAEQTSSRLGELNELIGQASPDVDTDGVDEERRQVAEATAAVALRVAALEAAQARAAEVRERQVSEEQTSQSLAALAQLALRHLGEHCPVCTQSYDRDLTMTHLQMLITRSPGAQLVSSDEVAQEASLLRAAEGVLVTTRSRLSAAELREREATRLEDQITALAAELELSSLRTERAETVSVKLEEVTATINDLQSTRRDGEALAVALARAVEFERLAEHRSQLSSLESDCELRTTDLGKRDDASNDAKLLHDSLRDVSETLVTSELKRIEPVLQRIYASVDPHPSFRAVQFLTDTRRGRGRMWTSVLDPFQSLTVNDPGLVLSSSQLNVLAVVAFLALNLSVSELPLQVIALDDPLQSLDNINLLGLSDLLRRLRVDRQVIISTHDQRLAGLLERKLRPVLDGERTTVITMDGWSRTGPIVSQHDVQPDASELRLIQVA